MSKQTHTRFLPETQHEAARRENSLKFAFLNATSAIGHRPKGRSRTRFNNTARESNPLRPWELFAEPLRDVAIEAAQRDATTKDLTEERIIEACIALLHYVLEPLDSRLIGQVTYLGVSKEVPEGVKAITTAEFNPTPENLADAVREAGEAARALQLHQGGLRRTRDYMRPMGASPLGVA